MSLIDRVVAGAGRLVGRGSRGHPVGGVLSDAFQRRAGVGDDWAPGAYADYLAVAPSVYACVNLRARNLARIPLRVHRVGANGEVSSPVGASHPAQRLFDGPNPFWSRQRFWYVIEASLCLWGSAPAAVFRDGRGEVRELWWLRPNRFRVVPDAAGYIAGYLYVKDGREIALSRDEVVWFRYPNPIEEYAGLSPIAALRMTVDMNVDAMRFNRRFFQNDASPGRVYLKADAELTSAQVDELRRRWEQSFAGREKSHAIAVLDKSADLKTMAISQREMEFIEAQRYTKEEICGAYGGAAGAGGRPAAVDVQQLPTGEGELLGRDADPGAGADRGGDQRGADAAVFGPSPQPSPASGRGGKRRPAGGAVRPVGGVVAAGGCGGAGAASLAVGAGGDFDDQRGAGEGRVGAGGVGGRAAGVGPEETGAPRKAVPP